MGGTITGSTLAVCFCSHLTNEMMARRLTGLGGKLGMIVNTNKIILTVRTQQANNIRRVLFKLRKAFVVEARWPSA